MTIAPWKKVMAILSAIGIVWAGAKNLREIGAFVSGLNGWAVLCVLCAGFLLWFVGDSCVRLVNRRFDEMARIASDRHREYTTFRDTVVAFMNQHPPSSGSTIEPPK